MTADERQDAREGRWAPPAARPGPSSAAASTSPASTTDRDGDDPSFGERVESVLRRAGLTQVDVPFESFAQAVRWWFRPIADPRTWRSLASLIVATVVAGLFFGLSIAIIVVTATLTLLLVGALLVPPAFAAIGAFASLGRRLAGWGRGEPIPPRPTAPTGSGIAEPIVRRVTDETRWRQVAFVLLDVVVAPLFLAGTILPLTLMVSLLSGLPFVSPLGVFDPFGLADIPVDLTLTQILFGIPLLGVVARLVLVAGRWRHRYVATLLGPDRQEELVERVEELSAQRDQVVDAVVAERRRIERNLHDGVQQQLVALGIDIGRASNKLEDDPEAARQLLDEARDKVRSSIGELRMIGRGLHPAVLGDRGLDAALSAVVANSPIPISVTITPMADGSTDLSPDVAETAYYVANEAVANVLKYSGARVASIHVGPDPGLLPALRVTVHDDGRGGADESRGSGIAGMRARVEAVDGGFGVESPVGGPTVVTAVIPLRRARHDESELASASGRGVPLADDVKGSDHG